MSYIHANYKADVYNDRTNVWKAKIGMRDNAFAETLGRITEKSADLSVQKESRTATSGNGEFVLHYFDAPEGCEALGATTGRNGSMTIYKPKDFDAENPVYKVRVWDADGNMTERAIDVSRVDVTDCDTASMFAYSCWLKDSGAFAEAQDVYGRMQSFSQTPSEYTVFAGHSFQKTNWLELAKSIMNMQYKAGNTKGYFDYKKFVDFFG